MHIVIIQNYWGRGETPLQAANAARKVAGKRPAKSMPKPRLVYSYDPAKTTKCYVDDMGALCWLGEKPSLVESVEK